MLTLTARTSYKHKDKKKAEELEKAKAAEPKVKAAEAKAQDAQAKTQSQHEEDLDYPRHDSYASRDLTPLAQPNDSSATNPSMPNGQEHPDQ